MYSNVINFDSAMMIISSVFSTFYRYGGPHA